MTDKPFGVNLTILPMFVAPPYEEYMRVIIEGGVKIVETAGPQPGSRSCRRSRPPASRSFTSARRSAIRSRPSASAATRSASTASNAPAIRAKTTFPGLVLLARAAEELTIPFVASGGMGNARSLVAALALGADGINMGTRFIATVEAPVHHNVKKALVEADELSTRLIMRPLRNTERVLTNAAVEKIREIEKEKGAAVGIEDIRPLVAGTQNRKVLQDGEMDAAAWSCGMVAGLIHDIPTCKELIERIVAEAEEIVRNQLLPRFAH